MIRFVFDNLYVFRLALIGESLRFTPNITSAFVADYMVTAIKEQQATLTGFTRTLLNPDPIMSTEVLIPRRPSMPGIAAANTSQGTLPINSQHSLQVVQGTRLPI